MITKEAANISDNAQERSQGQSTATDANVWLKERKKELDRLFDQKARELSNQAQTSIASRMQNYESALRSASNDLEENNEERLSSIATAAAQKIKDSANYIENADPKELVDDSAKIVRNNPYVALGASLLIGLAIGKLARTANRDATDTNS